MFTVIATVMTVTSHPTHGRTAVEQQVTEYEASFVATNETTVRVSGVIEKYERASRLLTLSTPKGPVQFVVPPAARVRQDKRTANASDLGNLIGCRAELRYSISGTNRTVESVHVFSKGGSFVP